MAYPVLSTYRLQLRGSQSGEAFTFADAEKLLDYLNGLGVSHLYLSPILTASPSSTRAAASTTARAARPGSTLPTSVTSRPRDRQPQTLSVQSTPECVYERSQGTPIHRAVVEVHKANCFQVDAEFALAQKTVGVRDVADPMMYYLAS